MTRSRLFSMFRSPGRRSRHRQVNTPEVLETRALLSNVSVSMSGSTLRLNGDSDANFVGIEQDGGVVTIYGEDGTTVNGESSLSVDLEDLAGISRVVANMRGGNDGLLFEGLSQNGHSIDATIFLGPGHDVLLADNVAVDDVKVFGGPGNDLLGVSGSSFGSFSANTGPGEDVIGAQFSDFGWMRANTGSGADAIGLDGVFVEGKTWIRTGKGADCLGIVDSSFDGAVWISTGGGDDFSYIDDSFFGSRVTGFLGTGRDDLAVYDSEFDGRTRVYSGPGKDRLDQDDNSFRYRPVMISFRVDGIDDLDSRLSAFEDKFEFFFDFYDEDTPV